MNASQVPDRSAVPEVSASFEESLAELQRVVSDLEQGELGLTDSLARYEQGIQHLKYCYLQLEAAESRLELLRSVKENGQADTEPFGEESMTLEEKASSRSARRSRSNRPTE